MMSSRPAESRQAPKRVWLDQKRSAVLQKRLSKFFCRARSSVSVGPSSARPADFDHNQWPRMGTPVMGKLVGQPWRIAAGGDAHGCQTPSADPWFLKLRRDVWPPPNVEPGPVRRALKWLGTVAPTRAFGSKTHPGSDIQ